MHPLSQDNSKLYPGGPIPQTWRRPLMVRQPYSVAVLSTGGRLHPLPFWKGRGLGSGLRTLPLGRDRWGRNSTKGGYILPEPIWTIFLNLYLRDTEKRRTSFQSETYQISSKINSKKSCFLLNEIKNLTGIIRLFTIKFVFLQRDSVSLK